MGGCIREGLRAAMIGNSSDPGRKAFGNYIYIYTFRIHTCLFTLRVDSFF